MRVYYDFEFLEGDVPVKFLGINIPKWLIKPNNTIQPISVGIVNEDGAEYYAISKNFNLKEAWYRYDTKLEQVYGDVRNIFPEGKKTKVYWIRENVLKPIFNEWMMEYNGNIVRLGLPIPLESNKFTYKNFKKWLKIKGKSNEEIASDVKNFCLDKIHTFKGENGEYISGVDPYKGSPTLYGYYSAYDHVALCWLFGKMIDLPKGFPMYTIDLKQILDEKVSIFCTEEIKSTSFQSALDRIKNHEEYPSNEEEHSAISDARWNMKLHNYLKK